MKKHKNMFSVVFNEIDAQQVRAIEILNSLPPRSIALYLSQAICAYERKAPACKTVSLTQQPTMPKRKRGRPSKKQVVIQEPDIPATVINNASKSVSESDSLSYKSSETNTTSAHENTTNPANAVNPQMLASMMEFLG